MGVSSLRLTFILPPSPPLRAVWTGTGTSWSESWALRKRTSLTCQSSSSWWRTVQTCSEHWPTTPTWCVQAHSGAGVSSLVTPTRTSSSSCVTSGQHGRFGEAPGHPEAFRAAGERTLRPGGRDALSDGGPGSQLHLHRQLQLLPQAARGGALRLQCPQEAVRLQVVEPRPVKKGLRPASACFCPAVGSFGLMSSVTCRS